MSLLASLFSGLKIGSVVWDGNGNLYNVIGIPSDFPPNCISGFQLTSPDGSKTHKVFWSKTQECIVDFDGKPVNIFNHPSATAAVNY